MIKCALENEKCCNESETSEYRDQLKKWCDHARYLGRKNDLDGAVRLYKLVLRTDRNHLRALANLGAILHQKSDIPMARLLYSRVLRINPGHINTLYNFARLEHDCNNYEEARELYERAFNVKSSNIDAKCSILAYYGLLLLDAFSMNADADRCFCVSLSIQPNHIQTLDHQCVLLEKTGQHKAANELHKKICDLDPAHR